MAIIQPNMQVMSEQDMLGWPLANRMGFQSPLAWIPMDIVRLLGLEQAQKKEVIKRYVQYTMNMRE